MRLKGRESLLQFLKTFYTEDKTLLACSGGADSVFLFHLLLELKKERKSFQFEVIHFNHGLILDYSEKAYEYVKTLCQKNHIPLHYFQLKLLDQKKNPKQSIEEIARQMRDEIAQRVVEENQLNHVSLAHHQEDQVETILMRLFKGSGVSALSGMKSKSMFKRRPLLEISKKDILAGLKQNEIAFIEDPSNSKTPFERNQMRNQVIPSISTYFPSFKTKILQMTSLIQELRELVSVNLEEFFYVHHGEIVIEFQNFLTLPDFFKRELLLFCVKKLEQTSYLSYKVLNSLILSLRNWNSQESKCLYSNKRVEIFLSQGKIWLLGEKLRLKRQESKKKLLNHKKDFNFFELKLSESVSFHHRKEKVKKLLLSKKIPPHHRRDTLGVYLQGEMIAFLVIPSKACYLKRNDSRMKEKLENIFESLSG